ncbi:hypothetical protein GCM10022397_05460 [Flavivirga jejuensis]
MAYGCESKPLGKYKSIGSGTKCKYLIPIKADLILKFHIRKEEFLTFSAE